MKIKKVRNGVDIDGKFWENGDLCELPYESDWKEIDKKISYCSYDNEYLVKDIVLVHIPSHTYCKFSFPVQKQHGYMLAGVWEYIGVVEPRAKVITVYE